MSKINDSILEAIDIMVQERIKNLNFNRYIQVQVTVVNANGTYNVTYKGQTITNVKARPGSTFAVNNVCWACIPNNEFSFLFLDLIVP